MRKIPATAADFSDFVLVAISCRIGFFRSELVQMKGEKAKKRKGEENERKGEDLGSEICTKVAKIFDASWGKPVFREIFCEISANSYFSDFT